MPRMRLVPCERCARHVREDEASCPFCAQQRPRRARAAVRAVLAASALVTVACGGPAAETSESSTNGTPAETSAGDERPADETRDEHAGDETNAPDEPTRGPDGPGAIAAYGAPSPQEPSPLPPPDEER